MSRREHGPGRTIGGVQIISFPEAATPPELRMQVVALQHQAWPPEDAAAVSAGTLTHDPALRRTVVTHPDARGRGHGRHLVAAAGKAMAAGDLDLGLFTCDRPLQGFYERAGWHLLPGAVLVGGTRRSPFPSDQPGFDKVTMADCFSAEAQRHQRSFHHARIELYPGDIDKLW
jgi:aminoglycoside 2'-N-acetyltransferase I